VKADKHANFEDKTVIGITLQTRKDGTLDIWLLLYESAENRLLLR